MTTFQDFAQSYLAELERATSVLDLAQLEKIIEAIKRAYHEKKRIFVMGNGGSAMNASHFAADLSKNTVKDFKDLEEKRFRITALTDNVGKITALANDLSFDDIFAEQLNDLVEDGDLVIVISGSGNSPNIIKAIEQAKLRGAKTIGLLGFTTGGKAKSLVDYEITVQNDHYGRIEDIHSIIQHIIISYFTKLKP